MRHRSFAPLIVSIAFLAAACIAAPLPPQDDAYAQSRATIPPVVLSSAEPQGRSIALTFDDGPSPYTPQVLAILHRYGAHATFFVVGEHVVTYPNFVRAEVSAGDTIGNHTYTHADLQWLSDAGIADQIARTQEAVRSAAHVAPQWLRPPFGAVDVRVAAVAAGMGLRTIIWSVDPRDWSLPGVGAIEVRVLANARPGSVILFHDGGGNRSESVEALPYILSTLKARGYTFVTLDTLFHLPGAAPATRPQPRHSPVRRSAPSRVQAPVRHVPSAHPPSQRNGAACSALLVSQIELQLGRALSGRTHAKPLLPGAPLVQALQAAHACSNGHVPVP